MGGNQAKERQRLGHGESLSQEEDTSLGPEVGKHAAKEGEEENWETLERTDEADLEGAVRELQYQPGLPYALHPGAEDGHQLPEPIEPVIALAQYGEAPTPYPPEECGAGGLLEAAPCLRARHSRWSISG